MCSPALAFLQVPCVPAFVQLRRLFTWGHVSKSSDVFAFGILLYEIVTGQRAYAGVPVSLLPHRVAVEGLRPAWPTGVPCELMRLAEACWVELPQNRYANVRMLTELLTASSQRYAGGCCESPTHMLLHPSVPLRTIVTVMCDAHALYCARTLLLGFPCLLLLPLHPLCCSSGAPSPPLLLLLPCALQALLPRHS